MPILKERIPPQPTGRRRRLKRSDTMVNRTVPLRLYQVAWIRRHHKEKSLGECIRSLVDGAIEFQKSVDDTPKEEAVGKGEA